MFILVAHVGALAGYYDVTSNSYKACMPAWHQAAGSCKVEQVATIKGSVMKPWLAKTDCPYEIVMKRTRFQAYLS